MSGFLKEFKEFAMKGNMIDLAVGFVLGAAFKSVVNTIVTNIIMPIVGIFGTGSNMADRFLVLSGGDGQTFTSLAQAQEAGANVISYGVLIDELISFTILAFVLFMIVKGINSLKKAEEAAPETPAEPPKQEVLLEEIRDLLKR
ncbi:MAG: large conductance mechanosensitive channel protein MscL [Deltaproteobacteria bacterium]|nr:large conductance mechanosensitive channel protein MscL [Deltaproteobacteria bacterium]